MADNNYFDRAKNEGFIGGTKYLDYNQYLKAGGRNMDSGFNSGSPEDLMYKQQQERTNMLGQQKAQEDDYLNRFKSTVSGFEPITAMADRIGQKYDLPNLQDAAFKLTQTLKQVPSTVNGATTGFDVNENQRRRMIGAQQEKYAPLAQEATSQAQFAQGKVAEQLQNEVAQQNRSLEPLKLEGSLMSERIARETTGYMQQQQSQLDMLIRKMQAEGALSAQEMQQANELAKMEKQYELQKRAINDKAANQPAPITPGGGTYSNNFSTPASGGWQLKGSGGSSKPPLSSIFGF